MNLWQWPMTSESDVRWLWVFPHSEFRGGPGTDSLWVPFPPTCPVCQGCQPCSVSGWSEFLSKFLVKSSKFIKKQGQKRSQALESDIQTSLPAFQETPPLQASSREIWAGLQSLSELCSFLLWSGHDPPHHSLLLSHCSNLQSANPTYGQCMVCGDGHPQWEPKVLSVRSWGWARTGASTPQISSISNSYAMDSLIQCFFFSPAWKKRKWSRSVVSDSLHPRELYHPTRLLHPWNFPSKSTGVGRHFLLQRVFPTQEKGPGYSFVAHNEHFQKQTTY